MPTSSHHERYFTKLLLGFASLTGSVLVTFYAVFEAGHKGALKGDWYFWAIVAAFLLCGGIYFCLIAVVHKIKSDFSKRQKQRDMQKSVTSDF